MNERLPRLSDLDHANVECPTCLGEGWVCERHPLRPWQDGDCCSGAGEPCRCNGITIYEKRRSLDSVRTEPQKGANNE